MQMSGMDYGNVRLPLTPLSSENMRELREHMEQLGIR